MARKTLKLVAKGKLLEIEHFLLAKFIFALRCGKIGISEQYVSIQWILTNILIICAQQFQIER